MNQMAAFEQTVAVARVADVPEMPGSPLGMEHLRGMLAEAKAGNFSPAKLGRWLGWAQCVVVAANVGLNLEDMKDINRRYSGDE